MNANESLQKAKDLLGKIPVGENQENSQGIYTTITEFLRIYAGEKSQFYKSCPGPKDYDFRLMHISARTCKANLKAFIDYLEQGLQIGISIERKVQIDVVSDFLLQAQNFLEDTSIYPAGPAMIIGACLEEFLRNWIEEEKISVSGNPSIDSFATSLRSSDLIDKQDIKDITSWGGTRNDAAHGHWDKVKNPENITLMLQGVNLFMRKHAPENRKTKTNP